jgi:hypothetical protein
MGRRVGENGGCMWGWNCLCCSVNTVSNQVWTFLCL